MWEYRYLLDILFSFPLYTYTAKGLVDHKIVLFKIFEELSYCFLQWLHKFISPSKRKEIPFLCILASISCLLSCRKLSFYFHACLTSFLLLHNFRTVLFTKHIYHNLYFIHGIYNTYINCGYESVVFLSINHIGLYSWFYFYFYTFWWFLSKSLCP